MRVGRAPGVRPQPARVARELALALEIQEEIDREGLTFRAAARRHGCSRMRICRLLGLARLAPDIQAQVADLTTTTALEALTVEDLRWVAEAMDWEEQRGRFALLLGGQRGDRRPVDSGSSTVACGLAGLPFARRAFGHEAADVSWQGFPGLDRDWDVDEDPGIVGNRDPGRILESQRDNESQRTWPHGLPIGPATGDFNVHGGSRPQARQR